MTEKLYSLVHEIVGLKAVCTGDPWDNINDLVTKYLKTYDTQEAAKTSVVEEQNKNKEEFEQLMASYEAALTIQIRKDPRSSVICGVSNEQSRLVQRHTTVASTLNLILALIEAYA